MSCKTFTVEEAKALLRECDLYNGTAHHGASEFLVEYIARLEAECAALKDAKQAAVDLWDGTAAAAEIAALKAENEALSEKLKRKDFQINDLKTTAATRRKQIKELKKRPDAMQAGEKL